METSLERLLNTLLPDLPTAQFAECILEEGKVTLFLHPTDPCASCPQCGQSSQRIRSRYWRTLWVCKRQKAHTLRWLTKGVMLEGEIIARALPERGI